VRGYQKVKRISRRLRRVRKGWGKLRMEGVGIAWIESQIAMRIRAGCHTINPSHYYHHLYGSPSIFLPILADYSTT